MHWQPCSISQCSGNCGWNMGALPERATLDVTLPVDPELELHPGVDELELPHEACWLGLTPRALAGVCTAATFCASVAWVSFKFLQWLAKGSPGPGCLSSSCSGWPRGHQGFATCIMMHICASSLDSYQHLLSHCVAFSTLHSMLLGHGEFKSESDHCQGS